MCIIFYFYKNDLWGTLDPSAKPEKDEQSIKILSSYLSEIDYEYADVILQKMSKKFSKPYDISSESWEVVVTSDEVRICFAFDDENLDFTAIINKDFFLRVISSWKDFLQLEPSVNTEIRIS